MILRFKAVVGALLMVIVSGCASHRPENNSTFAEINNLQQLEGTYRNLGESQPGTGPFYLSAILWPGETRKYHSDIVTIQVTAIGDKRAFLRGFGKNGIIREAVYEEGKDFFFDSGRIRIKRKTTDSGQGVAGVGYETAEIGIDAQGHGKYSQTSTFAGVVYLIPVAWHQKDEVRFLRIGK